MGDITNNVQFLRVKAARDGLRRLSDIFGSVLFVVGIYLGATMVWGGNQRFAYDSWRYAWQLPHASLIWGLPPLIIGVIGFLLLVFKVYHATAVCCAIGSFWSFLLGAFLAAAIPGDPVASYWWTALCWFVSFSYTMVALTFADRYL